MHKKNILILKKIQAFFGVGIISERKNGNVVYFVQSFNDLTEIIIPHFDNNPLLSKKKADFLLFNMIIKLLNVKAQSSMEGLQKIVNIRASMNKELYKKIEHSFS